LAGLRPFLIPTGTFHSELIINSDENQSKQSEWNMLSIVKRFLELGAGPYYYETFARFRPLHIAIRVDAIEVTPFA